MLHTRLSREVIMNNLRCNRSLIGTSAFAILFGFGLVMNYFLGELTFTFFWGVLVGVVLGILSCIYLKKTYDVIIMRPKDPNALFADNRGYAGVLLGVFIANIVARYMGIEIRNFVMGLSVIWLFIVFGYITYCRCSLDF